MAVPTMYVKLLGAFDAADDATRVRWRSHASKLRLVTSGSAALPVTVGERLRSVFGQYPLERFGMTEIGVGLTNPLEGERRPGTVGHPLPTVETRIVNDAEEDAAEGELLVRGPSVFSRYFERDEATRLAFVPAPDGGAPFFRTGDTVTRDGEGGPFRILGRTSVDILKSGGYKLSALEIEEAIRKHPSVVDVAVIGIPDERWGDRVVAVVHLREPLESETLRTFCKEHLAPYKVPRDLVFGRELPRNALGKVQKTALRDALVNEEMAAVRALPPAEPTDRRR
jgi:malonyl-CoA/methylmalonyl-CoA synthetase